MAEHMVSDFLGESREMTYGEREWFGTERETVGDQGGHAGALGGFLSGTTWGDPQHSGDEELERS